MTNLYERYVVKPRRVESTTVYSPGETSELAARIEVEDPSHPGFTVLPNGFGLAFESRAGAERIVHNARINREGEEIYLDVDPSWAHLPSR